MMSELGGLRCRGEDAGEGVAIDVRGLRIRYGSVDVLRGVEFVARRGEVLALLGPNGAGKTTTIEILEGFRMRSVGEVKVLGVDPARSNEAWRARVGVVLQSWRDTASGGCGSCSSIWGGTMRLMGRRGESGLTTSMS